MNPLSSEDERNNRRQVLDKLRSLEADELEARGVQHLLESFARASAEVPFYRSFLQSRGVVAAEIRTLPDFLSRVPFLDKASTFGAVPLADLCAGGSLEGVRSLLATSGGSGHYGIGLQTDESRAAATADVDLALQSLFDVDGNATLLVNSLPRGLRIPTRSTMLIDTGGREDMVFAVLRAVDGQVRQTVLLGEAGFLKKIIEEGAVGGRMDWSKRRVHLLIGEESIAENYRSYVARRLGVNPDDSKGGWIGAYFGIGELSLNLFHETRLSVRLRRLAHADEGFRRALFGPHTRVCPMFFQYNPTRVFVEECASGENAGELVLSRLAPDARLPLIRYRTGDRGRPLSFPQVERLMARFNLHPDPADLRLPFVMVRGRGQALTVGEQQIAPEEVKEALYHDPALAEILTGSFRLSPGRGPWATIELQRRAGPGEDEKSLIRRLERALSVYTPVRVNARFWEYTQFPYAMSLDYERKFQYL